MAAADVQVRGGLHARPAEQYRVPARACLSSPGLASLLWRLVSDSWDWSAGACWRHCAGCQCKLHRQPPLNNFLSGPPGAHSTCAAVPPGAGGRGAQRRVQPQAGSTGQVPAGPLHGGARRLPAQQQRRRWRSPALPFQLKQAAGCTPPRGTRPRPPPCWPHPLTRAQAGADQPGGGGRVIVFTSFRQGVSAIVEALRVHEPLISARCGPRLVGGGGLRKQGLGAGRCRARFCSAVQRAVPAHMPRRSLPQPPPPPIPPQVLCGPGQRQPEGGRHGHDAEGAEGGAGGVQVGGGAGGPPARECIRHVSEGGREQKEQKEVLAGCRWAPAECSAAAHSAGSVPAAMPTCQPSSRHRPGLAAPAQPAVPPTTRPAGRAPSTAWWPPASGRRAWTSRRRAPACPRGCLQGCEGLPDGRRRAAVLSARSMPPCPDGSRRPSTRCAHDPLQASPRRWT